MAPRDYAKKKSGGKASASRAPRKKAAPAKPQPKSGFPIIRIFLSTVFLVGFGYVLWQLTQVSPDPQAETPQAASTPARTTTPAPKPAVKAPKPAAKPVQKPVAKTTSKTKSEAAKPTVQVTDKSNEHYEFYEMLRDSEVDTSNAGTYKSTPKTEKLKKRYILQVGSFRNAKDAEQMRAKLIIQGLPNVHTRKVTNNDGSLWHQVLAGPFDNRLQLNKAQDKLVRMNINPLLRVAK